MKKLIIIAGFVAIIPAYKAKACPQGKSVFHKIVVQEVVQTTSYTYLHVKEADSLQWLAVPSMQAKSGETYYYTGGLVMKNFQSKELHRTFDEVLFLGGVTSASPQAGNTQATGAPPDATHNYTRKPSAEVKKNISVEKAKDGISIGELIAGKETLAGKKVIIRGEVTKYNPGIMDKNWIHLQDGTENGGKFDLTVTSTSQVKVGDVVTMEGIVTLNKDFGYGYHFDVIIENATAR